MKHRTKQDREAARLRRAKIIASRVAPTAKDGQQPINTVVAKPSVSVSEKQWSTLLGVSPQQMYGDLVRTGVVTAIVLTGLAVAAWWLR